MIRRNGITRPVLKEYLLLTSSHTLCKLVYSARAGNVQSNLEMERATWLNAAAFPCSQPVKVTPLHT